MARAARRPALDAEASAEHDGTDHGELFRWVLSYPFDAIERGRDVTQTRIERLGQVAIGRLGLAVVRRYPAVGQP
jgi:hypothetical protein